MEHEHLMPGESVISYSDNGLVTLTTHRIRYANKVWGQSMHISMLLENISAIQVVYLSYPILWIIGIIVALIGFMISSSGNGGAPEMIVAGFVGFFLIIAYFITRKHIFSIVSDGGTRLFLEQKMSLLK